MNMSIVMTLVKKDLYFIRLPILGYVLGASILGFLLYQFAENGRAHAGLLSFVGLCLFGLHILVANIVFERTTKTLPFVMSLPISQREYTVSKIVSCLILYLPAWFVFSASIIGVVLEDAGIPNTVIPMMTLMLIEILMAFVIIFAAALIKESFGWVIGALALCVVLASFSTFLFDIIAGLMPVNLRSPNVRWTPEQIMAVSAEVLMIVGILWFTYAWQIRKTDFVK